jgi:hypothetical protein
MDKNDGYNYINDDKEKEYIINLINETKNKKRKKNLQEYLETLKDREYYRDNCYWKG